MTTTLKALVRTFMSISREIFGWISSKVRYAIDNPVDTWVVSLGLSALWMVAFPVTVFIGQKAFGLFPSLFLQTGESKLFTLTVLIGPAVALVAVMVLFLIWGAVKATFRAGADVADHIVEEFDRHYTEIITTPAQEGEISIAKCEGGDITEAEDD